MITSISKKVFEYITIILFINLFLQLSFAGDVNKYEEGKLYRHKLENGMEILTMERHIAPFIYHQLTYKVGSRNEQLGITGISHVVEHMMFKGTSKYGKGKASKLISENAGVFNAFTFNDMTSYYEYLPANKIELAFDIESDRMQNCIFDPDEFKSEIQVILQERRMRSESSAQGIMYETMNSVAYQSHPNRDPIIGWPSDLNHITRDDAYNYYKTYYTPNNSFIVLIGDFDTDEIMKLVKKYYEKIPAGQPVPEMWAVEQPQRVKKTFTLYHSDVTQPSFRMALHAPIYTDEDAPVLRLAGMILCEKSRDARLYKRMVEKDKIATMVAGGMPMGKDPVLFSISVVMKPDSNIGRAEQIVWEEIKKMQGEPVTDHELQKVKNRYRFNQVTEYTKNSAIGSRTSRYEAYFGWNVFDEFDNRLMKVTKEDIQRVMNKYFSEEQVTIGYQYPKGDKKKNKQSSEDEEKEDDETIDLKLDENQFYFRIPTEVHEVIDYLSKEDFDDIIRPKPIAPLVKSTKLDNGITLYTIENHLSPSIFIGGIIETGLIPEAIEGQSPGIANLLTQVMNRGPENINYEEFAERLAFVPYSFSASGSYRRFSFQGYSLIQDADEMVKTGFDLSTKPRFDDKDINTLRERHIIEARNRFKRTSTKAFYYMFNKIFDDHVYSQNNSTEESLKNINKDALKDLHKKYFNPERVTLVMVGDMKPEEMKAFANKYFGMWKTKMKSAPIKEIPPVKELKGKEIKVFPEKDYTQCTINIGFAPFNDVDPDDEDAVNVLNYILASSALTSRMGIELRDKQGLIYGIKSELWSTSDNIGYWKFNTKTAPKNVEKVITGIFTEIKKLLKDGVTDQEIKSARQRLLGLLPLYIETPDDIASRVFEMLINKEPLDRFDKKADRILSVTAYDVLRVTKKYFTLDRFVIVVDGPIEENSLDHLLEKL